MTETEKYQVIMTTCPDLELAERIARELVDRKLGACVQIIPGVQSYFRWQGKIEKAAEYLVLIKTTVGNYQDVEKRIKQLHSYELPEIIALPITAGGRDYLAWIDDNTKPL